MNKRLILRLSSAIIAAIGTLSITGCDTVPEENPMSWSQPASWENEIPGMSGTTGTSDAPEY
jgi:hypothetical protein